MTETDIIKYCKSGDAKGFRILTEKYASKLFGVCLRYMQDEDEAKDVLQDSFVKIFKNIDKYKPVGSFESWLVRITITTSLMALRKKKNGFSYLDAVENDNWYVEPVVEQVLNEEDILNMILKLPYHYRIIFNLYVIDGYSQREIAELLQIKDSTVRTKLTRARKKMQEIYLQEINTKKIINKCD